MANYYKTTFNLIKFHGFSLTELENMLPWERSVYIDQLKIHLELEAARARDEYALALRQQQTQKRF